MHRAMQYLHAHVELGILYEYDPAERDLVLVHQRSDADLAGDTAHARSATGFHTGLRGARVTKMVTDWASRRQRATAPKASSKDAGGA